MSENVVCLYPEPEPASHRRRPRTKPLQPLSRVPETRQVGDVPTNEFDRAARTAESAGRLALLQAGRTEIVHRINERLTRLAPVPAPARPGNRRPRAARR